MIRTLTDIIIYPIKSLGGISLPSASLSSRGLAYDRRWMLVTESNHFLTIRQHPEFLFFNLELNDQGFKISKKGIIGSLQIPFEIEEGKKAKVKIWDDEVEAIEGDEANHAWFSEMLGYKCKLMFMPEKSPRRVQPEWVKDEEHVSFADAYPYIIIGQSSLVDLNSKLDESITMQRFRPNLVFKGGEAYEEFLWKDIEIGTGQLKCIKPVTRCIVITMNPETAEQGKEPLKTLFKQRINDNMVFGQSAILAQKGQVKVGDNITINSIKQSPYEPV